MLHVTTRQSVELIEKAKNEGLKVTAEVTPHHLTFSSEEIPSNNTSFKMNPPLHGPEHREALRMAIKSGVIDFLTTDHAPHEIWAKDREFADSAYGTTAMEAALRVLLEMKLSGEISSGKVVDLFSKNPAEFIGLSNEFGDIAVGRPFRAVLFDAAAEPQAVEIEDLGSLSKNSIFLGHPLPGRIEGHYSASGFFAF